MMRMITRMSPNDTVLSPFNKTASKQTPHHALGRGCMERGCWTDDRQYPSATPSAVLVKTEHFSNCPLLFSKQTFVLSPPWAAKKKEESPAPGRTGLMIAL